MMKHVSYAHAYRQNSVQTASPGQLILMLFDGALRFMNRALAGFGENEVTQRNEAVHVNLVKSQAIIGELQASLSHSAGGEFARTMSDLYEFMHAQLRQANLRKVPAPVQVVIELLGELRGAWSAMLAQIESQASLPKAWVATAA
ncbi:MAG: flagellar secretion chaperone FliS [Chthoniobacter sp.]|jgi:flagellar protein FliS|nr:flagellar secretion chaperone FliS [Chthoniobacter sp.]